MLRPHTMRPIVTQNREISYRLRINQDTLRSLSLSLVDLEPFTNFWCHGLDVTIFDATQRM